MLYTSQATRLSYTYGKIQSTTQGLVPLGKNNHGGEENQNYLLQLKK